MTDALNDPRFVIVSTIAELITSKLNHLLVEVSTKSELDIVQTEVLRTIVGISLVYSAVEHAYRRDPEDAIQLLSKTLADLNDSLLQHGIKIEIGVKLITSLG